MKEQAVHRLATQRALGLLAAAALAMSHTACGSSPTGAEALQQDLDVVRAANAKYQDVSVALQDGYVADPVCVAAGPAGAMGIHYVNSQRVDSLLVAERPEILLYAPEGGTLRLVAVEYMVPVFQGGAPFFGPGAPAQPGPTPTMFGQPFQGPMPGHNPAMPWHFDLHVWLFRDNPSGVFSQFNPAVSCS